MKRGLLAWVLALAACDAEPPAAPSAEPEAEPPAAAAPAPEKDARAALRERLAGTSWLIGEKKPSRVTLNPDGTTSSGRIKQAKGGQWDVNDERTIILSTGKGTVYIWMTFDEDLQTAEALWKSGVTSTVRRD